ncbi:CubicO group peptidase, beta-lactamase class C family [Jatrophihabitans endophyticus]|uniref:CubicO group peptidase, beta-lactamase class C family n=1 Tax=Jatrophihabitans endophyticus TaxID=1206085 RepID=A0A1M5EK34_9ACTN|nr:serine hydrolase domain-containing protein [Jatrophihabitans endophyticus]SHF79504.1 CubicO group peptidase, beta-lactamase class C family [Jatrophihabitans endophyticus]
MTAGPASRHAAPWPGLEDYYAAWVAYRRWYQRVPGVQLALRRHGDLALSAAFGHADLAAGTALTEDHLFRIASHSKTLAAVLVLQLVADGRLRLDDRLGERVPELAGAPVADRTVGELLAHGGGVIRDSEDGDFWQLHRPFPDRDELLRIARDASAATLDRNEHFKYSNIGYGLLGLVLEAVTGETYPERLGSHVARPLGLANLGGEFDAARAGDYAAGHSGLAAGRERRVIEHVDTRALAAATGSYADARDLTAFFTALLPGHHDLLDADSLRLLRRPHWTVKEGERRYALGTFLDRIADTDLFGHTGGYPGHITCTFADPAAGWVLSVLTNAIDGAAGALAGGFVRLRRLAATAEHATSDDAAARFTGRFEWLWGVLDVARLDGRLFALHPGDADPAEGAAALEVVDDRTLRIVGGRGGNSYGELMRYDFAADGTPRSVRGDSGMTMTPLDPALLDRPAQ